ncbi:MAG: choice-of-anchor B family protein [Bacteroidota bacterium]|nr:choice-of-anchor B family protein [Bacteroidota bacterium]MDE2835406.1 choice-of-anchor B family protein [Bacteroidota bacterium]MDE2958172.1 choice-of-anchor B family protein [Bacteroidota bacterium]
MKQLLFAGLLLIASPALAQNASTQLGSSFALGDGLVIAGQPADDENSAALRVFTQGPDGWDLTHTHLVENVLPGSGFGAAMDFDGGVLAVGAPFEDDSTGALYLFRYDKSAGTLEQIIHYSVSSAGGQLGAAIDLEGEMLVAGLPGLNKVQVLRDVGNVALSPHTIEPADASEGDAFGAAVATDGERVYVGAPRRSEDTGGVYVFAGEDFTQEAIVELPEHQTFGRDLVVTGLGKFIASGPGLSIQERRAAGQRRFRIGRNAATGPIVAVSRNAGDWDVSIVADSLMDGNLFRSGRIPLDAAGDRVFVGLPRSQRIQSYVREGSTGRWVEAESLAGIESDAGLGAAVAAHGNTVVALASQVLYGSGGLVVFAGDASGFERSSRLTIVEDYELTRSGRVDCQDGAALHFGCSNVDMLAFLPIDALAGKPGTSLNDIWGWTDPDTGIEYALVGRTDGTAFVDVSNPSSPQLIGDLPLTEGARPSSWRDIKVYSNHAYIVADGSGEHGMQIFDLTRLRDVEAAPVTFAPVLVYDQIGSAHNIVINEDTGTAYIVGAGGRGETCGGGLHMVDIRAPSNPVFAGCFADTATGRRGTGYTHDAQCVIYNGPDADHQGREICFNANETALSIADVTDKDSTIALSSASYPAVRYAHQGWLSEDQAYYFMNDETDELGGAVDGTRTLIWNVSDLDDPQLEREFIAANRSSDHNLYIRDNLMYQSNYGSGLRIFDVADPVNPVEVGYFDPVTVVPDRPGFIGSWSNYPYFESGTIVITGIDEGLFVLKRREADT